MMTIEQNIEEEIARVVMDEQPVPPPAAPKRKKKLTESTAAKVTAFLLLVVMTAVTASGVLGAAFLYSAQVYTTSEQVFKQSMFENVAWGDGYTLASYVTWDSENLTRQMDQQAAERFCEGRNIAFASVEAKGEGEIWRSGANTAADSPWQFTFSYDWPYPERPSMGVVESAYTVRIVLDSAFPMDDDYALANRVADLAYALRHWIYAIIAAAALLVAVCFVFLLCAAAAMMA